jgi:hypothetical protein
MPNPLARAIGHYVSDGTILFNIDRTDTPTADVDISLPAGDWWPSGDGTADDEIKKLEDLIQAAPGMGNFTVDINLATGITTFDCGAGETYAITWTDTDYRDRLRFLGAITLITDAGINSSRAIEFSVHPQLGIMTDDFIIRHQSSQSRSSSGVVDTVSYGALFDHEIVFQFEGPERSTSALEYHDLKDFLAFARLGKRFRVYPDRSDVTGDGGTDAYVEFTTPWGYDTYVLDPSSMDWEPKPAFGGWYKWFSKGLLLHKYVA